jgi:hypothetical protein
VDNDSDGFTDCADEDCQGVGSCGEIVCDDVLDNDSDGSTDCADEDCQGVGSCGEIVCDDVLDNDSDGSTDCEDDDCDSVGICEHPTERTCNDTQDNDGDGATDCEDDDCDLVGSCEHGTEVQCDDLFDNDADGLTDCNDDDCLLPGAKPTDYCQPDVFTFTDTSSNDVANAELEQFFNSISADPNDYLLFEIVESPGKRSICMFNAAFYRTNYLNLASGSGSTVSSGTWSKWHRSPSTSGAWTGPDTGTYANKFASDCTQSDSWCPEDTLGGLKLAVAPRESSTCEAQDFNQGGCGDGTWELTIKVGPTRQATCDF